VFGRLTPGCPRCDELAAGAAPVQWAATRAREDEARRRLAHAAHFRDHARTCPALGPGGGGVCTYGEW